MDFAVFDICTKIVTESALTSRVQVRYLYAFIDFFLTDIIKMMRLLDVCKSLFVFVFKTKL